MDIIFVVLAASSGLLFATGDIILKYWVEKSNIWFMLIAFAMYIPAGLLLAYSMKRKQVAIALAVLLCFNLIAVAVLGYYLFGETLAAKEFLGMGFAVMAIVLLTV